MTLAATTGKAWVITALSWSYNAAPTGGLVTVQDRATTVLELAITATGPGEVSLPLAGVAGSTGNAVTVTLAAAGAAVTGRLNVAAL